MTGALQRLLVVGHTRGRRGKETCVTQLEEPPGLPAHEVPLEAAAPPPPRLIELAHAFSIATEFWDWRGRHTIVATATICAVLAALDVDVRTHEAVERALAAKRDEAWRHVVPPVHVVRENAESMLWVHVPSGCDPRVWVETETGDVVALKREEGGVGSRIVDGRRIEQVTYAVPDDLPLGWHVLHADAGLGVQASAPLVVVPDKLALPAALAQRRAWGLAVQLYSVRSRMSWGLGDLSDLAEIASWSGREHDAGFILVNPLHAAEPVVPVSDSPYLPTSRRFTNPIYLRVEDIPEVAYIPATGRAVLQWQAEAMRLLDTDAGLLDRDRVWTTKKSALEAVFRHPRSRSREAQFQAFCEREGQGLLDFATWCALAERYGTATSSWPAALSDPRSDAVARERAALHERVRFHMWLQWCLDAQLERAQRVCQDAGMAIGIVHDCAVGVHPDGADAWALSGVLARDICVGAPPDAFNQQGQDWSQPPWRPDKLAEAGYQPYRQMLQALLRHAGGIRVDHIMGLFRLWWVPRGSGPAAGTYVRYDHEALVGILALEAHRAGAVVVGEDLGTVEPWVRDYLRERGIFGTSVLWFEKGSDGRPLRPEVWRELCLATVTTHDLPPTAGYLAGDHIALRDRLHLLTRPVAEEREIDERDRDAVLAQLRDLGLLGGRADQLGSEQDTVDALYRFLTWTPARLIGVSLADAVGERRTMNQPGTYTEYPNWRIPLADGSGRPVLLEEVMTLPQVIELIRTVGGR